MLILSNPLEQFEISLLLPFNILITNISISNLTVYFIINTFLISFFNSLFINNLKIFSSSLWQSIFEKIYITLLTIFYETLENNSKKYFPILTSLFMYVLISNLTGLLPYSFTTTSHLIVTFTISMSFFIGITLILIITNGINTLSLFLPTGVPLIITPLLIFIEVISYFIKVFTLAIRLFTNMTSGHTLLKVIASFC